MSNNYGLWAESPEARLNQVKAFPEGTNFYLFSTKWTNPKDGETRRFDKFVKIWWGENACGYTYDLNKAGRYSREEIISKPNYYCSENTYPLPVHSVDDGEFGRVMRSVYH